ncbi:MAG: glycosyltransferase family 4 protein [Pyrinomonadaceae bacterium]
MKILITAPSLDENENVSGISTVVRQTVEHGSDEFFHFQAGRRDNEKIGANWIFRQAISIPRLLREIRRRKIDLVHVNTALNPLSIARDFAFVAAARIARRKILLHLHGGRFLTEEFTNRPLEKLTGKMLEMSDAVIVLSEIEKQIIENRQRNLTARVLENAVSLDAAQTRKNETTEKSIVFLGRLHESKGLHEIIEACRILRNENYEFQFKCFGAGALKDFFISEMQKILGDRFYYGGVISGEDKWKRLAESDIFLLPSRYGEGLPMAMLEAMAAGCVVVVSDIASIRAVVEDGVNGLTVEPRNAPQVAEKLKFLLAGKAVWKNLRENARATIKEKFAIGDYVEKLEKIYREVLG